MRRAVLLLFATTALLAPAGANASAGPDLDELRPPPPHCDPAACPNPIEGAQDCANAALQYVVTGQPQGCDPTGRTSR